jgi:hypothetical protein
MIYKILNVTDRNQTIFGRIDDDGLCRVTCVAENPEFQDYLNNGGELEDVDGNAMPPEVAKEYVKELP